MSFEVKRGITLIVHVKLFLCSFHVNLRETLQNCEI